GVLALALVFGGAGTAGGAQAHRAQADAPMFTMRQLPDGFVPTAINNLGVVAGMMVIGGSDHAGTVDADRTLTGPGHPGGLPGAVPFAISDSGYVAGSSDSPSGARGFVYVPGGGLVNVGTLGGNQSFAYGVNDSGQVVGESVNASFQDHAFVWQNGVMT